MGILSRYPIFKSLSFWFIIAVILLVFVYTLSMYGVIENDDLPDVESAGSGDTPGLSLAGDSMVEYVNIQDENVIIHFSEDVDGDYFGIRHEYDSELFYTDDVPRFGGEYEIDAELVLACEDITYPSNVFVIEIIQMETVEQQRVEYNSLDSKEITFGENWMDNMYDREPEFHDCVGN